jgi:TolB-like protein/cytochrome c-type biogenesis protein CcmH/NrfG
VELNILNIENSIINSERAGNRRITQRLSTPLAALLLLLVALFVRDRFSTPSPEAANSAPQSAPDSAPGLNEDSGGQIYFGPRNSLAVLPFADASPAEDQEPQALGFAGDVLERLVDIPGLQATARRSAFFFRDGSVPPRVIAERLQSAFLLSGQWRNEGGRLTVTAGLYDARQDRETWREDFAGSLADLPALRDAIVVGALDAFPGVSARGLGMAGAIHPEAWLNLQLGLYQADPLAHSGANPQANPGANPGNGVDLPAAQASLQAALELDPGYEAARLSLAELWLHPAWPRRIEEARQLAETVLVGNPESARAWGLLSHIRHRYDWDWRGAADAGRRAVALRAGDAGLLAVASFALFTLAEFEEARELLDASIRRDPLNLGSRLQLGLLQEFSGLLDEALATYRQVLSLHPEYPAARAYRARIKVLQGKPESALRESGQEADPFWRRYSEILALTAAERRQEAGPLLDRMIAEDGAVAAFQLAEIFAFDGEVERAFEWLERARDQRDPGLSALLGNPLLRSLHGDPRWAALLQSLGLPPRTAA